MNSCHENGETPLHKSIQKGHESNVQFLLQKRAYVNLCNFLKVSPRNKAINEGHENTGQILQSYSAEMY